MTHLALVVLLGFAAGVLSGLFGVGGGILFVPALTLLLGLHQLTAEATSLAAIVPVVVVGAARQSRAGLVRWRPACIVGIVSIVGVIAGAALATSLSDSTLKRGFALLLLATAGQMAWRAWPRSQTGRDRL